MEKVYCLKINRESNKPCGWEIINLDKYNKTEIIDQIKSFNNGLHKMEYTYKIIEDSEMIDLLELKEVSRKTIHNRLSDMSHEIQAMGSRIEDILEEYKEILTEE